MWLSLLGDLDDLFAPIVTTSSTDAVREHRLSALGAGQPLWRSQGVVRATHVTFRF